ncbi:MAG: TOBE domain-containing protein [Pyrinomonadaceae bacterium]
MPIRLENASKRSGNQWAFRDVSIEVADGEIFGVFGPNGSGKDEVVSHLSPGEAAANGSGSLFARLFGGRKSHHDRFSVTMKSIEKASGPVFLIDPFSGTDSGQRKLINNAMRDAAGRGHAVIFASPDFADAFIACDRSAILSDGYIQQIGPPEALYHEPANRIVATFTGRNNILKARRLTSSKSEMPEFQTIEGGYRLFTQKADLRRLGPIHKDVFLAIRPEQVVISFGASFPEDNLLKATIESAEFLGPITYVQLDCSGMRLEAMVNKLVGLNAGDECMVGLPPDRIQVLPD